MPDLTPLQIWLAAIGIAVLGIVLLYRGRAFWAWTVPAALGYGLWWAAAGPSTAALVAAGIPLASAALVFGFRPLRHRWLGRFLMPKVRAVLPELGDTERIALEAGGV